MPKKDEKYFGEMTWGQSAKLWWASAWRGILISIVPLTIVVLALTQIMPKGIASLITNLLIIPILIAVQRHVINKIEFSDFILSTKPRSLDEK